MAEADNGHKSLLMQAQSKNIFFTAINNKKSTDFVVMREKVKQHFITLMFIKNILQ